jgi:uroporphyrinogen decarboxylase
MAATLTGRERVNRVFERRDHDRAPRYDSFWSETIDRWRSEGLFGDGETVLARHLEADLMGIGGTWPCPFPGQREVLEEDELTRVTRDAHGKTVRYWKNKAGTPEHLGFGCDGREAWEKTYKPALLDSGLQIDPEAVKRNFRKARQQSKWTFLTGAETFEQTRAVIGDEMTAMAMADDPQWIADMSRTYTDVLMRNYDAVMATGIQPDGVWMYGDMAYKTATMCSPAMYRELIWPDHKRLVDWTHAHGMKFIYHSDGDVNGVLDLYAQAGFDALQPLESKAGMDIRKLAARWGGTFAFFGNIDVMVMATNDKAKIEHEIATKLTAAKAQRAYMYHSDHSVPPLVSWETYRFIIELLDKHGRY